MRSCRATPALNDELAAGLGLCLCPRVPALQVIREAVRNALRHGDARHIEVSTTRQNVFVHPEGASHFLTRLMETMRAAA